VNKQLSSLILIALVLTAVGAAGCCSCGPIPSDARLGSKLTAVWKGVFPTGGFIVSGKLTDNQTGNPLGSQTILLNASNSAPVTIQQTTTAPDGSYKFTVTKIADTYQAYMVEFPGSTSHQPVGDCDTCGANPADDARPGLFAAGHANLLNTLAEAKKQVQESDSSQWAPMGKSAALVLINAVELRVKYYQYAEAAALLEKMVLPKVDKQATTPYNGKWIYDPDLQQLMFSATKYGINFGKVWSGQVTQSTTSYATYAETKYTPPLLPVTPLPPLP